MEKKYFSCYDNENKGKPNAKINPVMELMADVKRFYRRISVKVLKAYSITF